MSTALTLDVAPVSRPDRAALALGMTLFAVCLGYAIDIRGGTYTPSAIAWLAVSTAIVFFATGIGLISKAERWSCSIIVPLAVLVVIVQTGLLLHNTQDDSQVSVAVAMVGLLGIMQSFFPDALRLPLLIVIAIAFFIAGAFVFEMHAKHMMIDVLLFQQRGSDALLHGHNPYAIRYPNVYPPNTPFYGPGVVDRNNVLTYGYPYPPLMLLMALPGVLLGGDCRYAMVAAMALSGLAMGFARPGRWAGLAAVIFLTTPRTFYVLYMGWSEPLLLLNFSLVMLCACRWRRGLPWAFGLLLATKQYSILAIPPLWLLMETSGDLRSRWREYGSTLLKAFALAAIITLPFALWNFHEFFRAVVQWQFVQPFRRDALSYLVWIYRHDGGRIPTGITPLIALAASGLAAVWALWRCPKTPAGFAAACALCFFCFFALNKQAFCNYYYFVIAVGCWAIAVSRPSLMKIAPANPTAGTFPVNPISHSDR